MDHAEEVARAEDTRNSHVHPAIAKILNTFMDSHETLVRAEYLTALKTMDWQHEFADDSVTRNRGRSLWLRIRELQPFVDPDLNLFRAHRPDVHGAPDI